MNELILDGKQIKTKEDFHKAVKTQLQLQDWYGANLDAFYDVLTERRKPLQIIVRNQSSMRHHLQEDYDPIMATLLDAMEDNISLLLVVESDRQPEQKLFPKKLSDEELAALYQGHIMEDFPAEERKPLDVLLQMTADDHYDSFGWFDEQGNMMAYSLFARHPENQIVVLDYYAVCADFRGQKNGTRCLMEFPSLYPDCEGILAEVEDSTKSLDAEEQDVRERRIRFYERNGLKATSLRASQYGVPFVIFIMPIAQGKYAEQIRLSDDALQLQLDRIYKEMYPPEVYAEQIHLWQEK